MDMAQRPHFSQMHKGVNLHSTLCASACPVEGEASSSGVMRKDIPAALDSPPVLFGAK